jgi:hypothetical protein
LIWPEEATCVQRPVRPVPGGRDRSPGPGLPPVGEQPRGLAGRQTQAVDQAQVTRPAQVGRPAEAASAAQVAGPAEAASRAEAASPAQVTGPAQVTSRAEAAGPAEAPGPAGAADRAQVAGPASVTTRAEAVRPAETAGRGRSAHQHGSDGPCGSAQRGERRPPSAATTPSGPGDRARLPGNRHTRNPLLPPASRQQLHRNDRSASRQQLHRNDRSASRQQPHRNDDPAAVGIRSRSAPRISRNSKNCPGKMALTTVAATNGESGETHDPRLSPKRTPAGAAARLRNNLLMARKGASISVSRFGRRRRRIVPLAESGGGRTLPGRRATSAGRPGVRKERALGQSGRYEVRIVAVGEQ